jgi:predicted GIY-YIG superfamily endonuclease
MRGGWDIMTNRPNGTLYTGVTADISRRAYEHREGLCEGFTKRYRLARLVWYEFHDGISAAIQREKEHEALAARMEGSADPRHESGMAGLVSRPEQLTRLAARGWPGQAPP